MSTLKNKSHKKQTNTTDKTITRNTHLLTSDRIPVFLLLLFLGVDLIPPFGAADVMASQWVYLGVLNLLSIAYIFWSKNITYQTVSAFVRNSLFLTFIAFFVFAGCSIFFSANKIESFVVYGRLAITVSSFTVIGILLLHRVHLFRLLSYFLCLLLAIQCIDTIAVFFNQLGDVSLNNIIFNLKGNSGNKNILAISMAIKIPFAMYCAYTSRFWGKITFGLLIFAATLAISFVNARASFIALALQLILVISYAILANRNLKNKKQTLLQISSVLLPIVAAVLLSQVIISNAAKHENEQQAYGTVAERLGNISFTEEGSNKRLNLWLSALDYIKNSPLMGAGYGNWKLASIPYEREHADDMYIAYHAHNDFLETAAELGIPGGLLYLALFALTSFFLVKGILSLSTSTEIKTIAAFSFIAFSTYATDAFFNFPAERPVMQIFFVYLMGISISVFLSNKTYSDANKKLKPVVKPVFLTAALLLILPAIYVSPLTYKSMVAQAKYNPDVLSAKPVYKSDEVIAALPSVPNINAFGFPIDAIKARYLMEDKKYDEALGLLNRSREVNPNITYNDYLLGRLYLETNKTDSAYYYAGKAFFAKPRAKANYQLYTYLANQLKDSAAIAQSFHLYTKYRNEPDVWNTYITLMSQFSNRQQVLDKLVDSAVRLFPDNPEILQKRIDLKNTLTTEARTILDQGLAAFNSANYNEAAQLFHKLTQLNPDYYLGYENAGVTYYTLNNFSKAQEYFDKVISLQTSTDGKSEFFKGICLINLGQISEGCIYLNNAKQKNYGEADTFISMHCR